MKLVLPGLTSEFQHAFTSGRFMSDNVILSQDILDKINRRSAAGPSLAALKIDMSKAYDRVHWSFLIEVLRGFGFPARWLQLIYQCVSTVSYQTVINGKTSDQFRPRCGLRPLSPYLFLFCMDTLS